MTLWVLHTGRHGEYEEYMLKNNVIAIGWHDLPNLSEIKDMDELREVYFPAYGKKEKPKSMKIRMTAIWSFYSKMNKGDLVISPLKKKSEIIIGEIIGEYGYQHDSEVRHTRKVKWRGAFPRSSFDIDIQNSMGAQLTVSQVRAENAEKRVRSMLSGVFSWIEFYSEFADKLLLHKNNRKSLVEAIHRIYNELGFKGLTDTVLLQKRDSCPNWARWTTKPRTIRAVVCNDVINVVPVSDLHPFRWIDDTLAMHAIAIQCNIAMS